MVRQDSPKNHLNLTCFAEYSKLERIPEVLENVPTLSSSFSDRPDSFHGFISLVILQ